MSSMKNFNSIRHRGRAAQQAMSRDAMNGKNEKAQCAQSLIHVTAEQHEHCDVRRAVEVS